MIWNTLESWDKVIVEQFGNHLAMSCIVRNRGTAHCCTVWATDGGTVSLNRSSGRLDIARTLVSPSLC